MVEWRRQDGLVATAVTVGYGRGFVVEKLDLEFERASFTALVGPNGSGKSTILRAVSRLLPLRAGCVWIDGQGLANLSSRQLARRLGVLSQGPIAPEGLTVQDLVRQGRYPHRSLFSRWSAQDEEACEEALRLTRMGELRYRPLDSLSGGQRQRAWISMTLAQQTEFLLLDEPTTFLDLAHQIEILELIGELVGEQGKTVVAVLHDLNQAARYADRIAFLKQGGLVASGRPEELVTAELIEDVFGIRCAIIQDPVTGKPLCVPAGRRRD